MRVFKELYDLTGNDRQIYNFTLGYMNKNKKGRHILRNLYKIILLCIVLLLVIPTNAALASSYPDVPKTSPYYGEVEFLVTKGVVDKSTRYGLNDLVTREDVAVMVARAIGLSGTQTTTKFSDVPTSHRSSGYIQAAVEAGVINGYTDGTFRPNEKVTRGQMAAFIARGFQLKEEAQVTFKDVGKQSAAYVPIRQIAYKKITLGYGDGTFMPNANLSRAHISVFIARAMGYQKPVQQTPAPKPTPAPAPKPTPKPDVQSGLYVVPGAPTTFKNCTEMRKYYPYGVKKGHPAYAPKHDRDRDNWACER